MNSFDHSRRCFLRSSGLAAGALVVSPKDLFAAHTDTADYTVEIKAWPVEIARGHVLSTITYMHMDLGFMTLFDYT